ncbi:MAG: hypothetical protein Q8N44_22520, partial [Rubrivivax sp.]|nr:hypothetical protein [Rubrivivax sp.]
MRGIQPSAGAWRLALAAALGLVASTAALAQELSVYVLQGQLTRASQNITSLGAELMGDRVNLYTGALEFQHGDISLPGNSALPVALGRRHTVGRDPIVQGEFGDWDLDVPHIRGVFPTARGWKTMNGSTARCSNYGPQADFILSGTAFWYAEEFWQGNHMAIPGAGSQELLLRSYANTLMPSDGQNYPVVTRDNWQLRCLPSVANGPGEGFVALAPDGTQYRFDWMVTRTQPWLRDPG